jgi:predicted alpha/beta-fold hydrolase
MHFRGCGKNINRLPRAYHSGDTADAKIWIEEVARRYPNSKLFGIGYSLGGNMLLKLMGEMGKKSLLKACVSISAPIDLSISADTIDRGFSRVIYQEYLLNRLKKSLLEKYKYHQMVEIINFKKKDVENINSIKEFDDVYTAKIHNFKTAENYYKLNSAKQYLKDIKVPTLIIHSLDDPFMSKEILPTKDEISSFVELEISKYGGHVGFIEGSFLKPRYWLEKKIANYFFKLLTIH